MILEKKKSFILDASVDRAWVELKNLLDTYGYQPCIISIDISEEHLRKFYESKNGNEPI